jgi:stress-induced morphogen
MYIKNIGPYSGLSGCTAEEISKVNPEFINAAKISQSLTPGRNNGFLNMLAVMKRKAAEAERVEVSADEESTNGEVAPEEEDEEVGFEKIEGKPMYNAIMSRLVSILKPTDIALVDNSHQHAGHAGNKGWEESGESHFSLDIVAEAFDGLNLVKRHQLIYMLLGEEMPKIHALQIMARTPQEVSK